MKVTIDSFSERYREERLKSKQVKERILSLIDNNDFEGSFNKIEDYLEILKKDKYIVSYDLISDDDNDLIIWVVKYGSSIPFSDSYDFKRGTTFSDDLNNFIVAKNQERKKIE